MSCDCLSISKGKNLKLSQHFDCIISFCSILLLLIYQTYDRWKGFSNMILNDGKVFWNIKIFWVKYFFCTFFQDDIFLGLFICILVTRYTLLYSPRIEKRFCFKYGGPCLLLTNLVFHLNSSNVSVKQYNTLKINKKLGNRWSPSPPS